eukprot:gene12599-6419_t
MTRLENGVEPDSEIQNDSLFDDQFLNLLERTENSASKATLSFVYLKLCSHFHIKKDNKEALFQNSKDFTPKLTHDEANVEKNLTEELTELLEFAKHGTMSKILEELNTKKEINSEIDQDVDTFESVQKITQDIQQQTARDKIKSIIDILSDAERNTLQEISRIEDLESHAETIKKYTSILEKLNTFKASYLKFVDDTTIQYFKIKLLDELLQKKKEKKKKETKKETEQKKEEQKKEQKKKMDKIYKVLRKKVEEAIPNFKNFEEKKKGWTQKNCQKIYFMCSFNSSENETKEKFNQILENLKKYINDELARLKKMPRQQNKKEISGILHKLFNEITQKENLKFDGNHINDILSIFLLFRECSKNLSDYRKNSVFAKFENDCMKNQIFIDFLYKKSVKIEDNLFWYSKSSFFKVKELENIFNDEMLRLKNIPLCYTSNKYRKQYFDYYMYFLNQISTNKTSSLGSTAFKLEEIEYSNEDMLMIWFFLHNYGKLSNGRGVERYIFYRFWLSEDRKIPKYLTKGNDETPHISSNSIKGNKSSSEKPKESGFSISKYLEEKNISSLLEMFKMFNDTTKNFLNDIFQYLSDIFNIKDKDKIEVNEPKFQNVLYYSIKNISKGRWNETFNLLSLFKLVLKKVKSKIFYEAIYHYIDLEKSNFPLIMIYHTIRKLSYLYLDDQKNITSINLSVLTENLRNNSLVHLFSNYHPFGKQLMMLNDYYFENSILNVLNSEKMLKYLKSLDNEYSNEFTSKNIRDLIISDEYDLQDASCTCCFSLLMPRLENDFYIYFSIKNLESEFNYSSTYIASLYNSELCNCFMMSYKDEKQLWKTYELLKYINNLSLKQFNKSIYHLNTDYLKENLVMAERLNQSLPSYILNCIANKRVEIFPNYSSLTPWRYCSCFEEVLLTFKESINLAKNEYSAGKIQEPIEGLRLFQNIMNIDSTSFYLVYIGGFKIHCETARFEFDFLWITIAKNKIAAYFGEVKKGKENPAIDLKKKANKLQFNCKFTMNNTDKDVDCLEYSIKKPELQSDTSFLDNGKLI